MYIFQKITFFSVCYSYIKQCKFFTTQGMCTLMHPQEAYRNVFLNFPNSYVF